jgi:hypothetical protein
MEGVMPITAPIALLLLISVALGVAAVLRRSRTLGLMAAGALLMSVLFIALLAVSLSSM